MFCPARIEAECGSRRSQPGSGAGPGCHPAWTPADGGPDGWEQEVGCYFYEGPGSIVPLRPAGADGGPRPVLRGARPRRRAGGWPVRILLTVEAHRRRAAELAERYAATGRRDAGRVELVLDRWDERAYWISEHSALVLGDVVISRGPELEIPRAWVGEEHYEEVGRGAPSAAGAADRTRARHARRARPRERPRCPGGRVALLTSRRPTNT